MYLRGGAGSAKGGQPRLSHGWRGSGQLGSGDLSSVQSIGSGDLSKWQVRWDVCGAHHELEGSGMLMALKMASIENKDRSLLRPFARSASHQVPSDQTTCPPPSGEPVLESSACLHAHVVHIHVDWLLYTNGVTLCLNAHAASVHCPGLCELCHLGMNVI